MVTCQSANQLKTPAKVSWAFKMVSQFGSLGYTIMGKTADLTVVQKTIIDTLHKEGKPQTFIAKQNWKQKCQGMLWSTWYSYCSPFPLRLFDGVFVFYLMFVLLQFTVSEWSLLFTFSTTCLTVPCLFLKVIGVQICCHCSLTFVHGI